MTRRYKLASAILGLLTLLSQVPAIAQETDKAQAEPKPGAAPVKADSNDKVVLSNPRLDRALLLISQVGDSARQFEKKDQAAMLLAKAGELLWKHDQENARRFFNEAYDAATEHDRAQRKTDQLPPGTLRLAPGGLGVRQRVIRVVARYDDTLAEKFIKQLRDELEKAQSSRPVGDSIEGTRSESGAAYLSAAQALIESNPARAAELAAMALKDGIPQGLPAFLYSLGTKSAVAADDLYRQSLARARALPFGMQSLGAASFLAAYPFGDGQVTFSDGQSTMTFSFASDGEKGPAPNPALQQEFLSFAFAQIMAPLPEVPPSTPDEARGRDVLIGSIASFSRLMLPKFSSAQPDSVPAVEERIRVLGAQMSDARRREFGERSAAMLAEQASATTDDPVQRALDRASSESDPDRRAEALLSAAMAALRRSEFARARDIAQKVTDAGAREQLITYINFDAARGALRAGDLDEARELARAIPKIDQRAFVLSEIAEASAKKEDRARTIELLDETDRLAAKANDSPEKGYALIRVVNIYSHIDPVRAFEVLAEAVDAINRVKDFDIERPLTREVRLRGSWAQVSAYSPGTFGFESALERLALDDFDRALGVVQKLQQSNLNALAILAVSKSALTIEKKPQSS